jgi:hypothetical protein
MGGDVQGVGQSSGDQNVLKYAIASGDRKFTIDSSVRFLCHTRLKNGCLEGTPTPILFQGLGNRCGSLQGRKRPHHFQQGKRPIQQGKRRAKKSWQAIHKKRIDEGWYRYWETGMKTISK